MVYVGYLSHWNNKPNQTDYPTNPTSPQPMPGRARPEEGCLRSRPARPMSQVYTQEQSYCAF